MKVNGTNFPTLFEMLMSESNKPTSKKEAALMAESNFFKSELHCDNFNPEKPLWVQGGLPGKAGPWEKVKLDFSRFPLANEHLHELADFIDCQPVLLRHLELHLSKCCGQEAQAGLERVLRALENATGLQTLVINLGGSASVGNDETLVVLGKSVVGLHQLKRFSLDVSDNNFSSKGVAETFFYLSNAEKLKEISLDFSGGKKITADTFQEISNSVKQLKYLKKLSLDFSCVDKVDDEAAGYFGWIVGNMSKELEEFNVNIGGTKCSNEGVEKIVGNFSSLDVKILNIYAFNAAKIDQKSHEIVNEHGDKNMQAKLYTTSLDFV